MCLFIFIIKNINKKNRNNCLSVNLVRQASGALIFNHNYIYGY